MKHQEIIETLNYFLPDSKWQLTGDDFADVIWIEGEKPTFQELKSNWENLPLIKKQAEEDKAAKKAAAEAKLAALGLTADDLKALGIS